MKYQVAYNASLKIVRVQADGDTAGSGFTVLDKFDHPDSDSLGRAGVAHALYSHVQDVMYRKAGIQDMQRLSIEWPAYVAPNFISAGPTSISTPAGTEGTLEVYSDPQVLSKPNYSFIFNGSEEVLKINKVTGKWAAVGPGKGVIRVTHADGQVYVDVPVNVSQAGVIPSTAVAVAPKTATVNVNQTTTLTATKTPANSTDVVEWSSDKENIATVVGGVVTGKAPGTATITARTETGKTDTAAITVTQPVQGVTLAPVNPTVAAGSTVQLTATVTPANASNKAVTYTSATPAVATVNATGLVTGVAAGTSVITVKTTNGAKTATTTVTVTE
ncbi:hypothetical protein Axy10_019 [Achromobacter phage vB_AxyP_19-32_Axy10]|uniref:BIG2 domain-containing protein n=1 Tax=Achromobacter phage vB_AxyP_19-32_Axy10 TaxID=2591041 RepID=A0A514CTY3_9CAUD|nr:structural protein with Ig domain [Achromobacter phage vB_AxyP_19-32_Axy10]QDH83932.1 hypothetical protein Axy10_019 [Achromobacter phage vB_AxyP_19-32_Axy10]